MPLSNFGKVCSNAIGNTLFRSAQPDARGFQDAFDIGIKVVFSLNNEPSENFRGLIIHTPLLGWSLWYSIDKIKDICRQIDAAMKNGSVLVHCTHGRDRTGMICAAYLLMFQGRDMFRVNRDRADFGVDGIISLIDLPETRVLEAIAREYH